MPKLHVEPTATAQWQALVQAAGADCGTRLDEPVEAYLVFMLMRFAGRPDVGRRALAIDFLEASQEPERQADRLRDTGDECLLVCGLFPQRARRRRVSFRYYVDLGRGAYGTLARSGRGSVTEPFGALAAGFVRLMEVLQAMRARAPGQGLSPLDAAEVAVETGARGAWERVQPDGAELVPDRGGHRRH